MSGFAGWTVRIDFSVYLSQSLLALSLSLACSLSLSLCVSECVHAYACVCVNQESSYINLIKTKTWIEIILIWEFFQLKIINCRVILNKHGST